MAARATYVYSRLELLRICVSCQTNISAESSRSYNIPEYLEREPGSPWIPIPTSGERRRRSERRQKRGRRAGVLARLRKRPHKPPLPSLSLANLRSLADKMDDLRLQAASDTFTKDCCVLLFTETWLHPSIPDSAIELANFATHRLDRTGDSGKSSGGGGLCMYIHNSWCNNAAVVASHCSPDLEYLTVKCRPFYLPREFTGVTLTIVYIPPDASASPALELLHSNISRQQSLHPDMVHIVAGDFNHADLKSVLPELHQHVECATGGASTLGKVFTNIELGYKARPAPHKGKSDHITLQLIPTYTPLSKSAPTTIKTIKTWPRGASEQLEDCLDSTDWGIFEDEDLDAFTDTVLCYVKNCPDTVAVEKRIRIYPNEKPWMTGEVKRLLRERNAAFRAGDRALYSAARANLKRGVREAKEDFHVISLNLLQ